MEDLGALYKDVYKTFRPTHYFFQKYNTAYTGIENAGFIAYGTDKKPVAFCGAVPCFIQYEKKLVLAAQCTDTMTHPKHRNKGLFAKVSAVLYEFCRESGIKLLFKFPNQNAYPVAVSFPGWTETERMSRFSIQVDTVWERAFFKVAGKSHKKIISNIISGQPDFHNSVIANGYAGVYRDEAYMSYKACSNTYLVNITSASLWLKAAGELIIGDIMLMANDDKYFFDEIKTLARNLKLPSISFQISGSGRLHDLFAGSYKAIPSFPVLIKDFGSGLPPEKIKFTFADIDIF